MLLLPATAAIRSQQVLALCWQRFSCQVMPLQCVMRTLGTSCTGL
jgi:hypothetical protein